MPNVNDDLFADINLDDLDEIVADASKTTQSSDNGMKNGKMIKHSSKKDDSKKNDSKKEIKQKETVDLEDENLGLQKAESYHNSESVTVQNADAEKASDKQENSGGFDEGFSLESFTADSNSKDDDGRKNVSLTPDDDLHVRADDQDENDKKTDVDDANAVNNHKQSKSSQANDSNSEDVIPDMNLEEVFTAEADNNEDKKISNISKKTETRAGGNGIDPDIDLKGLDITFDKKSDTQPKYDEKASKNALSKKKSTDKLDENTGNKAVDTREEKKSIKQEKKSDLLSGKNKSTGKSHAKKQTEKVKTDNGTSGKIVGKIDEAERTAKKNNEDNKVQVDKKLGQNEQLGKNQSAKQKSGILVGDSPSHSSANIDAQKSDDVDDFSSVQQVNAQNGSEKDMKNNKKIEKVVKEDSSQNKNIQESDSPQQGTVLENDADGGAFSFDLDSLLDQADENDEKQAYENDKKEETQFENSQESSQKGVDLDLMTELDSLSDKVDDEVVVAEKEIEKQSVKKARNKGAKKGKLQLFFTIMTVALTPVFFVSAWIISAAMLPNHIPQPLVLRNQVLGSEESISSAIQEDEESSTTEANQENIDEEMGSAPLEEIGENLDDQVEDIPPDEELLPTEEEIVSSTETDMSERLGTLQNRLDDLINRAESSQNEEILTRARKVNVRINAIAANMDSSSLTTDSLEKVLNSIDTQLNELDSALN